MAEAFPDVPLVFNWVEGGKTPALALERIRELGFALVIYPVSTLLAASRAVSETLARLREDGTTAAIDLPDFDAFTTMIGLPEVRRARGALRRGLMLALEQVREAAALLDGVAHRTPVMTSRTLDAAVGGAVHLKCESFQRGGAFKFRGAFNFLSSLSAEERERGVARSAPATTRRRSRSRRGSSACAPRS